jgi:serine/threonine protein phosphatase PrpC
MRFDVAVFSETGPRAQNEDKVGVWRLSDARIALAVADGLGGHAGGQFASELAIDALGRALTADTHADLGDLARSIHAHLKEQQALHPEWGDMATTLSAAVISTDRLVGIHAGDSRIIVSRGGGIRKLTEDHTEVQRLLSGNRISPEEAQNYPRKHILDSALGIKTDLRLDPIEFDTRPGDRIFLSSDGVHGKVFLRELLALSSNFASAADVVQAVKDEVEKRSPEDNYSLICCIITE